MKRSTKLLLAVLTLAVFALVGTNLVLKAEYERIDFSKPFWNYERIALTSYPHLSIQSSGFVPVEIRDGAEPALYVLKPVRDSLRLSTNRDSLTVRLGGQEFSRTDQQPGRYLDEQEYWESYEPRVVLIMPRFQSVRSNGQTWLRLQTVRLDSLQLTLRGHAVCTLRDSRFGTLNATLLDSSFATLAGTSRVQTLNLDATGKTGLKLSSQSVQRFQPLIRDERVELRVSGKALAKIVNP